MADLPGLSTLRNFTNGNRAYPASATFATNRQQQPNKQVPMVKITGAIGPFSGKTSVGPSRLRGNEWRRRRALAEHTAEDLASLNLDSASNESRVSNYRSVAAHFCPTTILNYLCGSLAQ
jgi:hypothetical protein